jgi:hypothetical protein
VDGKVASEPLPPADRGVDVKRIEFDPVADAADAFGSEQG